MQSVSSAFTAESTSSVRKIASDLLVSWKKDNLLGNRTFTIGVSLIGGGDVIGANPGAVGSPGQWRYFDESEYLLGLAWERSLNMPTGGLTKGLAEARLDNTSGRFTPRYMGGSSELYTAILPRRPFIINAGFDFEGIDQTIPQFSGILTRSPRIDVRSREIDLQGADYADFFQNRKLDRTLMFTSQRTDQVMETLLVSDLGMATSQYELDTGINIIPFGMFEKGISFNHIFDQLTQAENGQSYFDEEGIFRFENRQHWDSSPHIDVQSIIYTAQVIEAEAPSTDHIINVVEVRAKPREKQPEQTLFKLAVPIEIGSGDDYELFVQFDDPILAMDTPVYEAFASSDGTGTDLTDFITIKSIDTFAQAAKIIFSNNSSTLAYITDISITGRPAKIKTDLYYRAEDDSSVTAYEERILPIENDFIQDASWANSLAQMILNDFSDPENLQEITIRAMPQLQLGDLISWQGRHWRIYGMRTTLNPSYGFVQELRLLQREVVSYFRIGISTIGGSDQIAP